MFLTVFFSLLNQFATFFDGFIFIMFSAGVLWFCTSLFQLLHVSPTWFVFFFVKNLTFTHSIFVIDWHSFCAIFHISIMRCLSHVYLLHLRWFNNIGFETNRRDNNKFNLVSISDQASEISFEDFNCFSKTFLFDWNQNNAMLTRIIQRRKNSCLLISYMYNIWLSII